MTREGGMLLERGRLGAGGRGGLWSCEKLLELFAAYLVAHHRHWGRHISSPNSGAAVTARSLRSSEGESWKFATCILLNQFSLETANLLNH